VNGWPPALPARVQDDAGDSGVAEDEGLEFVRHERGEAEPAGRVVVQVLLAGQDRAVRADVGGLLGQQLLQCGGVGVQHRAVQHRLGVCQGRLFIGVHRHHLMILCGLAANNRAGRAGQARVPRVAASSSASIVSSAK